MVAYTKVKYFVASLVAASVCFVFVVAHAAEKSAAAKTESAKTADSPKTEAPKAAATEAAPDGKELFNREWLPNDSRAKGGDGLGPVFNDSSCVACHSLGGDGGGGPASKNVDIITAFANPMMQQQQAVVQAEDGAVVAGSPQSLPGAMISMFVQSVTGQPQTSTPAQPVAVPPLRVTSQPAMGQGPNAPANADDKAALVAQQKAELAKIHPGFLTARSVVLHHFSTNEKYEPWRMQMLGFGGFGQQPMIFNTGNVITTNATLVTSGTVTISNSAEPTQQPTGTFTVDLAANAPQPNGDFQPTAFPTPVPATEAPQFTPPAEGQIVVANLSQQANMQVQQLRMAAMMNGNVQSRQTQVGNFSFVRSRRNATALFGDGLIDKVSDATLVEQAKKEAKDSPDTQGRVSKMKDGKIGRFGWKAQKDSLYEFAMTACAVELGLEVPNHPQAGMPLDPKYKAKGNDMDQAECDALVAYLTNLPAPVQRLPADKKEAKFISAGEKQFASVGFANCHSAKLGEVAGIYSDLLLHDMGADLGDAGNYGSFVPDAPEEEQQNEPVPSITAQQERPQFEMVNGRRVMKKVDTDKIVGAMRLEWRTPPLWGVRDSGPYLHDGRAETLEQAIAFHGGQGSKSAEKFFLLKPEERMQVIAFLKSLTAPEQSVSAE